MMLHDGTSRSLDIRLSQVISIHYTVMIIKNMVVSSSQLFLPLNSSINTLIMIVLCLLYGIIFLKEFRELRFLYVQIGLLLAIVVFWIISFLNDPSIFDYYYVNLQIKDFVAFSLPMLIFVPMLEETDTLLENFYKASYLMFIGAFIASVLMFINYTSASIYSSYNMSFGRNAMIPCIFLFSKYFTEKKTSDFILASSLLILILIFGSRFPLLCISFYIIMKLLRVPTYKKVISLIGLLAIGIPMILYFQSISYKIMTLLERFGIRSRTLLLFSHGQASYSSGRTLIHKELHDAIKQSPIWGYGAGAGNIILNDGLPHGFVIDTFANFGYIFGGIFLLLSGLYIFYAYKLTKRRSGSELLLILAANYLPISTIQLALWRADTFWFSIALSISLVKQAKRGKSKSKELSN